MNNAQMVVCFNEWMRRFIEDPVGFQREFETVNEFLREQSGGEEPSYGEACAAYMVQLAGEATAS